MGNASSNDEAITTTSETPSKSKDEVTTTRSKAPSKSNNEATTMMSEVPSKSNDEANAKSGNVPSKSRLSRFNICGPSKSKETSDIGPSSPKRIRSRNSPSQVNMEMKDPSASSPLPSPPSGAAASDCSNKQPGAKLMDLIPSVSQRDFMSFKAHKEMTENPAAAVNGKNVYRGMLNEGKVKMYRQKITGMDFHTLKELLNTIKDDWGLSQDIFPRFEELIKNVISDETITFDKKEDIEMSPDCSECLVYNLQSDQASGKYHFAICHIIAADLPFNKATAVGGLMLEGLLGKDEKKNLYLQF